MREIESCLLCISTINSIPTLSLLFEFITVYVTNLYFSNICQSCRAAGCFDVMFVVVMAGSRARTRSEALSALGVQGLQAQDSHRRPKESGYAP